MHYFARPLLLSNVRCLAARKPGFLSPRSHGSLPELKVSAGSDVSGVSSHARQLVDHGWQLDSAGKTLEKTYFFKTYTKVLDFVSTIGIRSKSKGHHPLMTVRSGSVNIQWTTHVPDGLSDKDTFMAKYSDDQARLIGTVARTQAQNCHSGSAPTTD